MDANRDTNRASLREPKMRIPASIALATALMLHAVLGVAGPIPMADKPLYLGGGVRPNVFFMVDDSGSMEFSIITRAYWEACAYDSNFPGEPGSYDCGTFIEDGAWYDGDGDQYEYMFDASDNDYGQYDAVFGNEPNTSDPIPDEAENDWRIMSSALNVMYFDPSTDYPPWWNMSDASFSSARSHPDSTADGYNDTKDLEGFTFAVWEDNRGFDGFRPYRGSFTTSNAEGVNDATASDGSNSMFVSRGMGDMATRAMDTSAGNVTVTYWIAHGLENAGSDSEPPESGEDVVVEYRDISGNWQELDRFTGDGSYGSGTTWARSHPDPAGAAHDNFALRVRAAGGTATGNFDYWHIDDIEITAGGSTVFSDSFESGAFDPDKWAGRINANDTPNGIVDLWDDHTIYTVYDNRVEKTEVTYSPGATGLNRSASGPTTVSDVPAELGKTLAELKQDVANWFQYSRRRLHVATGAIGSILDENPNYRYGLSVINNDHDLFEEVPGVNETDFGSHNTDLFDELTGFDWPAEGTPLRRGLERAGEYYSGNLSGKTDPIKYECQQNFSVLLSDGYYSGYSPNVGDQDGDGIDDTLADVARKYYTDDLDTNMEDNVPPTPADPATHQHMVTFTVAFGLEGTLSDTDSDGWPNPELDVGDAWTPGLDPDGNPQDTPLKIDDMWHAAFNSKGTFVSAKTPEQLVQSMEAALGEIDKRDSSAAAVALNSQSYSTDSLLYQARFNSDDWSGQLLAFPLVATTISGTQRVVLDVSDTPDWDAADILDATAPGARDILTFKPSTDSGIPFRWPADPSSPGSEELDSAQTTALNTTPGSSGATDGKGADRLSFLRGDRSDEGTGSDDFRERASVLGDIIDSAPVFVGDPTFLYPEQFPALPGGGAAPETSYSAFHQQYDTRQSMIYVGANDGMLHGFDAETGDEELAFVPSAVFDNLNDLTDQDYDHNFYVDGSPVYGDAFFDGSWHSVVAGGLRAGGQGIYALDVTDPSSFSESQASDLVLWEFTDHDDDNDGAIEGDKDLGFTFGQPSIVRLKNGDWAAVFGNGYNNTQSDGNASSTGNAVLYIVDIGTGELIRKIDTGVGMAEDPLSDRPNGLSAPAPVDVDGDSAVDYVYAGDMFGNMWKFDLTSGTPSDWGSAVESGNSPAPMFTAISAGGNPQPITVRPQVGRHPAGKDGRMVYFGTGKYIGSDDNVSTGQTTQSFYAIWDRVGNNDNQTEFTRSDLLEQEVTNEVSVDANNTSGDATDDSEVRITSDNDIGQWYGDGTGSNPGKGGWFIDLVNGNDGLNHGEKAVTDPVLRNDRIIFTTLIPSQSPCDFGGGGWLMELSSRDGGHLAEPAFDLNDDATFDGSDTHNGTNPGGLKSKIGIVPTPAIMLTPDRTESKFMSGSTGEVDSVTENSGDEDRGRQAWEELR